MATDEYKGCGMAIFVIVIVGCMFIPYGALLLLIIMVVALIYNAIHKEKPPKPQSKNQTNADVNIFSSNPPVAADPVEENDKEKEREILKKRCEEAQRELESFFCLSESELGDSIIFKQHFGKNESIRFTHILGKSSSNFLFGGPPKETSVRKDEILLGWTIGGGKAEIKATHDGVYQWLVPSVKGIGQFVIGNTVIAENTSITYKEFQDNWYREITELRAQNERNEIARKLKEKQRKRNLEKQVRQELIDSGELFENEMRRPPIPEDVKNAVWKRDCGKCVYCGSTKNLQYDHIIPFSKGGATSIENLQILCQKCNLEKSNKIG